MDLSLRCCGFASEELGMNVGYAVLLLTSIAVAHRGIDQKNSSATVSNRSCASTKRRTFASSISYPNSTLANT